jgi:hypothetical protein
MQHCRIKDTTVQSHVSITLHELLHVTIWGSLWIKMPRFASRAGSNGFVSFLFSTTLSARIRALATGTVRERDMAVVSLPFV